jgi:nitrous oxidase accessory protein NosD
MPGTGGGASDGRGLLNVRSISEVEIRNLAIDCNEDNQAPVTTNTNGVYIWESDDVIVQDCYILNVNAGANGDMGNGVRVNATNEAARCLRLRVNGNHFYNINASYPVQWSNYPEHCSANDNRIVSCTHGIDWSTGYHNTCSNNIIQDVNSAAGSIALSIHYAHYMEAMGNVIENCSNGINGHAQDCVMTGNLIRGASTAGTRSGINLQGDGLGRNAISGNHISGFAIGIAVAGATTNNAIVGNVIDGCPLGIDLTGTNLRDLIAANSIRGGSTAPIRIGAGADYIFVHGNMTGAAITDNGGVNSVISDNFIT